MQVGTSWDFTVKTDLEQMVHLHFALQPLLDAGSSLLLEDLGSRVTIDLNTAQEYSFMPSSGQARSFRITVAGDDWQSEGEATALPRSFELLANYPNPFNASTKIPFYLPRASSVSIIVSNSLGQRIRTLYLAALSQGSHEVEWDGLDEDGVSVASGVYFYRLETDTFVDTRKMLLLK